MKRASIFILLTFFSFQSQAQLTQESIDIAGTQRTFYQYLPTAYNSSEILPVVIVLHGLGDNASNMSNVGFNQIADTARFIPVYLEGLPNTFSQNSWNNGTLLGSTGDDILFISSVIDRLEDSLDVDLSRVYITGFSMGGIMSYTTCSQLSDRIAAMASFSGTMSSQEISASGQQFPVPTLHCHGTVDATVPYSGTALPSLSLVEGTMDKNKTLNGWAGDSTIYNIPDNVSDGITIEKIVYNTTTPLELWKMTGADHIWPYQPVNDTSAVYVAWYFFSQHQHPNPSTASTSKMELEMDLEVYPNPTSDFVRVVITSPQAVQGEVKLMNVMGQEVETLFAGELSKGKNAIEHSLEDLPNGIYFLNVSYGSEQQVVKLLKQ